MVVPGRLPSMSGVHARENDHGHGGDAFAEHGERLVVGDAEGEFGDAARCHRRPDENVAVGKLLWPFWWPLDATFARCRSGPEITALPSRLPARRTVRGWFRRGCGPLGRTPWRPLMPPVCPLFRRRACRGQQPSNGVAPGRRSFGRGSPDGIRTRATALRGRRARPLHNGAPSMIILTTRPRQPSNSLVRGRIPGLVVAGVLGLEPRLTEPESVGLPITLYPTCAAGRWCNRPGREEQLYTAPPRTPQTRLRYRRRRWTRFGSRNSRNNPYASAANRAKPPMSKPASTQLISRTVLSVAIEVVNPAMV